MEIRTSTPRLSKTICRSPFLDKKKTPQQLGQMKLSLISYSWESQSTIHVLCQHGSCTVPHWNNMQKQMAMAPEIRLRSYITNDFRAGTYAVGKGRGGMTNSSTSCHATNLFAWCKLVLLCIMKSIPPFCYLWRSKNQCSSYGNAAKK